MSITTYNIPDLQTEQQIRFVKERFYDKLLKALHLHPVFTPLFVKHDSGINDDLNGIEQPVTFTIKDYQETFSIVHSLAKWKRLRLKELGIAPTEGVITQMIALRPEEQLSPTHSILVDQWDWEVVIAPKDRVLDTLKKFVCIIYQQIFATEQEFSARYPELTACLPDQITFLHTEALHEKYPDKTSKEIENIVAKKYGAVFLIGIGGALANGRIHDGRAPDYDDWSTATHSGYKGLNGDILVWHPVLGQALELSSMGIRVDQKALLHQLRVRDVLHRQDYPFHRLLLQGALPESIGGGIGQSRLAMFMLKQPNISSVQYNHI